MVRAMLLAVSALLTAATASAALDWVNLDEGHKLGGRKLTSGYMRGKTVLVCRDMAMAQRMEEIWESFRTKPFILLGSYPERVSDCSYPVYSGAGLAGAPENVPLYVVDETGHYYYKGKDDRNAVQAIVMALTDTESPKTAKQFKKFLDWEIAETPGAAFNRFLELKKRFPEEVKGYTEQERTVKSLPDAKRIAELVQFARMAKDFRDFDPKKASQKRTFETKLKNALVKYAQLKESSDPRIAQEAKNSLADIKIKLAEL